MHETTLTAITAMLTGLGIPHGTDADILLRTYAIAVHGIREDAIRETCGRYIRGEVEGHKKGRAPTTDLFTAECRSWANAKTAVENRKAKQIESSAVANGQPEYTLEHRMMMGALLKTLNRALNGERDAQEYIDAWMAKRGAPNHGWGRGPRT